MSNGGGEGVEVVEERVAGLNVDGNGGRETGAWGELNVPGRFFLE